MQRTIYIFHGTEGYPEENWFPWLKTELEKQGHRVIVPQFPTPPLIPAKINEWFEVLSKYEDFLNKDAVIVGHSLGGVFALRVMEKLSHPIHAACFVGTPVGIRPIANYDRDSSFSGFEFDWSKLKDQAKHFLVFQSDDDPYVGLENGKVLAEKLGTELTFIPNAGHFNLKAGYREFPALLEKLLPIVEYVWNR